MHFVFGAKEIVKKICEITSLADKTVHMTSAVYDEGGIDATKPKTHGKRIGKKRHLASQQEKKILDMIIDQNPDQYKLKGYLWTRDSTKKTDQGDVRDRYAHHDDSRRIHKALRTYRTATLEAGGGSEA